MVDCCPVGSAAGRHAVPNPIVPQELREVEVAASDAAEACAHDLGRKTQWDKWARECSDVEYVSIAKVDMEIGKAVCDRYSQ